MVPASNRPTVHSAARRLGACGRTTNLLNASAIFAYGAPRRVGPLYEAQALKTAHQLSSILNSNALAQSTTRYFRGHLVRRPVLFAAALCLSRPSVGCDQHSAL